MTPYEHEGVTLDLCQKCRGLWFDTGELRKVENIALELVPVPSGPAAARVNVGRVCPRCAVPLSQAVVRDATDLVLDECGRCMGLFLDAGELRRIQFLKAQRIRKVAAKDAELLRDIEVAEEKKRQWLSTPARTVDVESPYESNRNLLTFLLGIPTEESNDLQRVPYAVYGLMLAIVGVFLWQVFVAPVEAWRGLMLVPADILAGRHFNRLITSMFLHGGWLHLVGNLYFLWTFGDNVEDRVGSISFLAWYLAWGLASGIASAVLATPDARDIPHLGASGAIAGALGAYVVLFPRNRIAVRLWGFLAWGAIIKLPAWCYLGFWVAWQFFAVSLDLPAVDWWAHIAGFAAGGAVGLLYRCIAR
jgi:membrane associated rhomboid family serine protease/Zn-finger nucleic acid-binding protein